MIMVLMLSLLFAGIVAAEEPVRTEVEEDYVGKDLELEAAEAGITAVPEEEIEALADEEDYVGKGVELEEGEFGITSVSEDIGEDDYVGKDMDLAEGEVGIISYTGDGEEAESKLPLYGGILAAIVLAFVAFRKILVK
jgi:hypothetical protein